MESKKGPARWLPPAGAAVLYTALALIYLQPVWRVWQDRIAPNTEDPLFNLWVLKWDVHQLRLGLPDLWNANIYHPTRGTLALSDHLIGPAVQLALFETVVPNAIAGYNALFFTSFVLSGLAVCWIVRRGGASWTAAILAGMMFAFSPFRIGQLNHLQLLLMQWVPLTLWLWDRLLAERTPRRAALFLAAYLLNVSGGAYLAYMVHIPMLVMLVNRSRAQGRSLVDARSLRVLVPVAVVAGAALAVVFLPYVRFEQAGLTREPDEAGHYGATLASWLSPARDALWFGPVAKRFLWRHMGPAVEPFFRTENALFAGFLPTIFAAFGVAAAWKRYRQSPAPLERKRKIALGLLLTAAAAAWIAGDALTLSWSGREKLPDFAARAWIGLFLVLIASLAAWQWLRRRWGRGPVLRWDDMSVWMRGLALSGLACFALAHPIVYVPLMRVVPGLNGMRVPARFAVFVSLAVAVFAAGGIDLLLLRVHRRGARLALAGALFLVLAAELAPRPVRWARLEREEDFPEVYSWLAGQKDIRAILELPIRPNASEITYMYYSTRHWKPIANGYSGYVPESHKRLTALMRFFPDANGLDAISEMGITHLVVHTDILRRKRTLNQLERWEKDFLGRRVELVHASGEARVYRVIMPP